MSSSDASAESADRVERRAGDPPGEYVVIARRYRPQGFDELLGQQHVSQALGNAIASGRVGHAYLFTGARGVGKTSTARILAKSLNCQRGVSATPCNECDVCLSVSQGEDIDVLEIDGASNRGIEEIRQLRQNVGVRPSRARFKIYIIDEVHMLTREAFNALLKTLEEPPEHVKFIFCTTEPTKIPITILSRCQRFDFAAVEAQTITDRLRQIVAAEGVEAEPEALQLLARRAAGSLRDSQSLLEQLLAFAPGKIGVADVHAMLGTAGDERMALLVRHLVEGQAAAALAELDTALGGGVEVGVLIEQLLGVLRDAMLAAVGCPGDLLLHVGPQSKAVIDECAQRWGLAAILAAVQILDQTLGRMRVSTQGRVLAEMALVRICNLGELDDLAELVAELRSGNYPTAASPTANPAAGGTGRVSNASAPAASPKPTATAGGPTAQRGNAAAADSTPSSPVMEGNDAVAAASPEAMVELNDANAQRAWSTALDGLGGMVVDQARTFDRVHLESPDRLVVNFRANGAIAKATCEKPEQAARFEQALAKVVGRPVRIEFRLSEAETAGVPAAPERARAASPHQRMLEVMRHPMVHRAAELFGAQPTRVDDPPPAET